MICDADSLRKKSFEASIRLRLEALDGFDYKVEFVEEYYGKSIYLTIEFGGFYFKVDNFAKYWLNDYWLTPEFLKEAYEAVELLRETKDYKTAVDAFKLKTLINENY